MRTQQIITGRNTPAGVYFSCLCRKAKALRNTANFYIRNTMTAIQKNPGDLTDKEKRVLSDVMDGIRRANAAKDQAFTKKAAKLLASGYSGLIRHGEMHEALKRAKHFEFPAKDNWFLNYNVLDAIFRCLDIPAYRALPAQVNQACLRLTTDSWKAYFAALKSYRKNPGAFNGMPRIPGYLKGESTCPFTNQTAKLVLLPRGYAVSFPAGDITVRIGKPSGSYVKTEVRPEHGCYKVLVTFDDKTEAPEVPGNLSRIIGLDPGVNNFIACANNFGVHPFIIRGKLLKSINQWFNKRKADLVSAITSGKKDASADSKALDALSRIRDNRIRDFFYKSAHYIAAFAKKNAAEVILVGHNEGQKDSIGLGGVTNQNFVSIPYTKFIQILKCVALKYGIPVLDREESYTSMASLLNMDYIPTYGTNDVDGCVFSGKRADRGLYRTNDGRIINADVNGACNLIRKQYPHAFDGMDLKYLYETTDVVSQEYFCPRMKRKPHKRHMPGASHRGWHRKHANDRIRIMEMFGAPKQISRPVAQAAS